MKEYEFTSTIFSKWIFLLDDHSDLNCSTKIVIILTRPFYKSSPSPLGNSRQQRLNLEKRFLPLLWDYLSTSSHLESVAARGRLCGVLSSEWLTWLQIVSSSEQSQSMKHIESLVDVRGRRKYNNEVLTRCLQSADDTWRKLGSSKLQTSKRDV